MGGGDLGLASTLRCGGRAWEGLGAGGSGVVPGGTLVRLGGWDGLAARAEGTGGHGV